VERDANFVETCLEELRKGQFTIAFDSVPELPIAMELLEAHTYDVMIIEYTGPLVDDEKAMQLLDVVGAGIPLVFLTPTGCTEGVVELLAENEFECVERQHLVQLPMAVRRALNAKQLRAELESAEKALRHSQSLYKALVSNPSYGVCRCDAEGKFLDVNLALLNMLGYESKEELIAANCVSESVLNLGQWIPQSATSSEPVEIEWQRKNGTFLKARLSGRDAFDERGNFNGCEVIVVDMTEHRKLEEQLRLQAATDSLTGLANHRSLLEVLQAEICRSKRTGRSFSLLLLDLDGLKKINDSSGHLAGDRALCRLGQILRDCCRSVDTAARHGGDEFAVVLPETSVVSATLVARRICELLSSEIEEPALSVSLGIASYPHDADAIGTLLYAADRALYAMKSLKPSSANPIDTAVPSSVVPIRSDGILIEGRKEP
jgi:diguanylate cyclase (GGDEF)-like protein/PAS domain S-box-containing protein